MSLVSWRTKVEVLAPKARGLVASIHRAAEKVFSRKLRDSEGIKKRARNVGPWPLEIRVLYRLFLLGLHLDVLNHSAQFFPEPLVIVVDAVHVSTCSGHALDDPTRFLDVRISHLVQRKLR